MHILNVGLSIIALSFAARSLACSEVNCRPGRAVARDVVAVLENGSPRIGDLPPTCSTPQTASPPAVEPEVDELDEESRRIAEHPWNQTRGRANCEEPGAKDPKFEVLEVNPGYFILRQNKCTNFEAPFIYIMLGPDGAFMHDSGAGGEGVNEELLRIVDRIVGDRPLTVGHGHSHGDHVAGDSALRNRPNTRVIGAGAAAATAAYGITSWPTGQGQINLGGGRIIDVLPIPGHASDSVAFYDRQSGDMLTGDSLYPGNVFVSAPEQFAASNRRLWEFTARNNVRNVLGSHIEMTDRPGVNWPYPHSDHSTSEHSLVLRRRHICQLSLASNPRSPVPTNTNGSAVPGCNPPYTQAEVGAIAAQEQANGRQLEDGEIRFRDFLVPWFN